LRLLRWLLLLRRQRNARRRGRARSALWRDTHSSLPLSYAGALQRRLSRRIQQPASIDTWVIDELPIVVMILLIELPDSLVFADADNAHNRPATEDL